MNEKKAKRNWADQLSHINNSTGIQYHDAWLFSFVRSVALFTDPEILFSHLKVQFLYYCFLFVYLFISYFLFPKFFVLVFCHFFFYHWNHHHKICFRYILTFSYLIFEFAKKIGKNINNIINDCFFGHAFKRCIYLHVFNQLLQATFKSSSSSS